MTTAPTVASLLRARRHDQHPGYVFDDRVYTWAEVVQQSIERALLKRRCQPEDLAEVVVFLGFGAAMVTGQTITVDGGLTL